jgi:hypothetical protein
MAYFQVRPQKWLSSLAVEIQDITPHIMFLGTAALGALLDIKPASDKDFTNLIFTPTLGSTSLTSYQTPY